LSTRTPFLRLAAAALLFVTLTGCGPAVDDESAEGLSSRASIAMESGDWAEAATLYGTAIGRYPDSMYLPQWHLGRGIAMLRLGRLEEALSDASLAAGESVDSHTAAAALLLTAEARIKGGSVRTGTENLMRLDTANLEEAEAGRAVVLLREALVGADPVFLADGALESGWTRVFFLLEMESRYAAEGDVERASLTGMEIDRLFPDAHLRYGRPEYGTPQEGGFVALVLPVTGSGSMYTEHVSSGVQLAFSLAEDTFRSVPDLVTFDFQGDSTLLVEIMETLGANPRCLAVIGPLTSRDTGIAGVEAQSRSLPMISPTATSAELDDLGDFVHRLVISEGDDASAVAEYAVRRAGCLRLAIIHEFTSESVAAAEQFQAVIEELGAEVVASEGYETGATDFRSQISSVKYRSPDGIFLPVTAWDAIQIAPQLAFYRVDCDLFGTSGWDDEILVEQGGEYVEGAVFPVAFGSSSINPVTARFSYFYEREYDASPTLLAAQGYDAAEIVLDSWEGGTPSRSSLERHLEDLGVHFGASGICTIGQMSIPRSSIPLVTVTDGEILSVE
jgi:branched-chain amino acid transport system substrate-binding protein